MNLVAEFAEGRVDEARLKCVEQQRLVTQEETRLSELCRFRDEYASGLNSGKEIDVLQLLNHRQFLQKLNEAIAFQSSQIQSFQTNLTQKTVHLRQAHSRAKALENVVKRLSIKDQNSKDRQEQAQMDDFNQSKNFSAFWTEDK